MSANNRTTCPKCWAAYVERVEAETAAVMALYGTVPVEEFDAKRTALPTIDHDQCTALSGAALRGLDANDEDDGGRSPSRYFAAIPEPQRRRLGRTIRGIVDGDLRHGDGSGEAIARAAFDALADALDPEHVGVTGDVHRLLNVVDR